MIQYTHNNYVPILILKIKNNILTEVCVSSISSNPPEAGIESPKLSIGSSMEELEDWLLAALHCVQDKFENTDY